MALRQLFQQSTGSMNPSYLTGVLPGGAGTQVAGVATNPGISAPYIEQMINEVFDVTAPTTLTAVAGATTPATPAAQGKLLVLDPVNSGPGGWKWKLNSIKYQAISGNQYGIVYKAANATVAGIGIATSGGNIASPGDKALVVTDGPIQAFCTTTPGIGAISAGMPLAADGAGNLTTINQGTFGGTGAGLPPLPGAVLATAMDTMVASVSIPALRNVYVGGF
jgi:hypothetical protein